MRSASTLGKDVPSVPHPSFAPYRFPRDYKTENKQSWSTAG